MNDLAARLAGARLDALPRPADVSEYDRAAEQLETALRALPGAVAVYRTGAVSAPGISDLDRIVVVERDQPLPDVWPTLAARTRQLAMHSPFLVDVDTFAHHRAFAHVEPLALAWGEQLDVAEPPHAEWGRLVLATEGTVALLLVLVRQALVGRVRVRSTLCALHALRHDLALAGCEHIDAPASFELAEEVTDIRATWFEQSQPPVSRLREVLAHALPAIAETLVAIERRLGPPTAEPRALPLGGGWANVRLVAGDGIAVRPRPMSSLDRLPARLAQLAWRSRSWELTVPRAVLAVVAGDAGISDERKDVVRRYREFLRRTGGGYSAIGFATTFARS